MLLNPHVKDFYKTHEPLIRKSKFDDLFFEMERYAQTKQALYELANVIYTSGIFPLPYMSYVPPYLFNKRVETIITLPNNITRIAPCGLSRTNATKIIIPSSVKHMEYESCCDNMDLEEIVIEEGLTIIRGGAFRNCPNLKTVWLPKSLREISHVPPMIDPEQREQVTFVVPKDSQAESYCKRCSYNYVYPEEYRA